MGNLWGIRPSTTPFVTSEAAKARVETASTLASNQLAAACCGAGDEAAVTRLLALGARPDGYKNGNGSTALIWASYWGHQGIVAKLIKAGADVNHANSKNGSTALIAAAATGRAAIAELLVATGEDVNCAAKDGWTPLMFAAHAGHAPIAQLLVDRGADVNAAALEGGSTALMLAARNGEVGIARLLVRNGAALEAEDELGDTALKFALHYDKPEVAALLRATGAREPRAAAAGADVVKLKRSRRSSRRLSGGGELARR